MNLIIIIYVALAALCFYLVVVIYQQLASPLRDIPGPFAARFSTLWYLYQSYRGNFHHQNIELHRKHGRIVRIAPGTYSISEPDKAVYGVGSRFPKSDWYQAWKHPDLVTLFADTDIKRHNDSRRRVQSLYSLSSLVSYEAPVNDCNTIFCRKLEHFATTGETINLTHWLQCYAFDAVGCITFSKRFGFLDQWEDISGMIEANAQLLLYSTTAGLYPSIHRYLYPILERIPGTGASGLGKITSAVYDMISLRRRSRDGSSEKSKSPVDNQPRDFLDRIMNTQDADPTKVTESHILCSDGATSALAVTLPE
ncbi:hypothetical protein ACHAPT_009727 [Fusarium lateritium]